MIRPIRFWSNFLNQIVHLLDILQFMVTNDAHPHCSKIKMNGKEICKFPLGQIKPFIATNKLTLDKIKSLGIMF